MCCGNSILQKGLPFFYLHKIFYTLISISKDPKYSDILEVLQKVYLKLEKQKYELDPGPLINRLVNYLYFTAYTNKIRFTEYQEELIRNLSEIGRTAGINGLYRADYGDKSQF
ncbi:bacteriocin immunity protein [Enterococcus faecium]|nr:bacteriocin immunity protein [Enterococcus faecium]